MKLSLIGTLSLAILLLIAIVFCFKTCTGFVTSFDGESHERMKELINNYCYSEIDSGLWIREEKTKAYRRLVDGKVDSLAWNSNKIIGYSGGKYFTVNILTGEVLQLDHLIKDSTAQTDGGKFSGLKEIPMPFRL